MANVPKYRINSNLSEKQIEADVASYLGWCSPDGPFRLLDVDEQITGADKLLYDIASFIFIQFKKSEGLKSITEVAVSKRKNPSQLEEIRQYREDQKLESNPTLFFKIRDKAATAIEFQHNILLKYERPPSSRGIYVAPLTLDKYLYHNLLFNSSTRYLMNPFHYQLRQILHHYKWVSHYGRIPFLREHISIPPYEEVTSSEHYYAYSETGVDISWHSPRIVKKEPSRLSDFLVDFYRSVIRNPEAILPLDTAAKQVSGIGQSYGFQESLQLSDENSIDLLRRHGRWLYDTHNIRQFMLLSNSIRLKELQEMSIK